MIERRRFLEQIEERLGWAPVVALLGARQVGKTTLARQFVAGREAHYFDLESPATQELMQEPATRLERLTGLVVLDEAQRIPKLFPLLRVLADRRPLPARFLILGSASPWLMKGITESLAGRVSFIDVPGLALTEVGVEKVDQLWWRGGYPRAYLAGSDAEARQWQEDLERTVMERDLAVVAPNLPAAAMRRFWSMVAHYHGQTWNSSEIGRSLNLTDKVARQYLDAFTAMHLVRQLPPWFENVGKRQVKAPKVYLRDSGVLHELLHLENRQRLEEHPKVGASWEGFALEQVLSVTGDRDAYFWATHNGAELDLLVQWQGQRVGFEFKYGDAPGLTKSMHIALRDLKLDQLFVVYPGGQSFALGPKAELVAIRDLPLRLDGFRLG
ncbi:MAG: ATP-binding protein [Verrucomicrobia bacterium]|nr:ATP-binding protein [Verrucomicrobiota bacterium]